MAVKVDDLIMWPGIEALEYGECNDPCSVLAPRVCDATHIFVSAFFPKADEVKVKMTATGRSYAMEKYYTLDDMAVLALYQRIDERQTSDHVVTSDEVEHIIDAAIKKANKKNLKHLGDVLFGKRYNDEDLIVLREKDFAK